MPRSAYDDSGGADSQALLHTIVFTSRMSPLDAGCRRNDQSPENILCMVIWAWSRAVSLFLLYCRQAGAQLRIEGELERLNGDVLVQKELSEERYEPDATSEIPKNQHKNSEVLDVTEVMSLALRACTKCSVSNGSRPWRIWSEKICTFWQPGRSDSRGRVTPLDYRIGIINKCFTEQNFSDRRYEQVPRTISRHPTIR
jgi:hypothetical protein